MAGYAPFAGDEDDEDLRRLLESTGEIPTNDFGALPDASWYQPQAGLPAPDAAPAVEAEPAAPEPMSAQFRGYPEDEPAAAPAAATRTPADSLAELADRGSYTPDLPDPPMMRERGDEQSIGMVLALLADAALNKGSNAGLLLGHMAQGSSQDVPYENYKRQRDHAKSLADLAWTNRRGTYGENSEAALELARRRADQADRRLGQGDVREGRLGDAHSYRYDPSDPRASRMAQHYTDSGVEADQTEGMSSAQLQQARPLLQDYARQSPELAAGAARLAARKAGAVSDATQANKIEIAQIGAQDRAASKVIDQQLAADRFYTEQADKYWKETEFHRNGGRSLRDAEAVMARYAPGEDLPGAGKIDSNTPTDVFALQAEMGNARGHDAMKIRSAQNWMNNAIQRSDSGAAAPIPEELKFAIRSGANPGATEREFRIGMEAAREYLRGNLRSAAAGKESAARDVLRREGLEDWAFGDEPAPTPRERPPAPTPKPRRPTAQAQPAPAAAAPARKTAQQLADEGWE